MPATRALRMVRPEDAEDRRAGSTAEREVDEVGARVDRDRVRAYETLAADHSRLLVAAQLERRDDAVLGRCVDLLRSWVEREHVDLARRRRRVQRA